MIQKETMDFDEFHSDYFGWITAIIAVPIYWIYLLFKNFREHRR